MHEYRSRDLICIVQRRCSGPESLRNRLHKVETVSIKHLRAPDELESVELLSCCGLQVLQRCEHVIEIFCLLKATFAAPGLLKHSHPDTDDDGGCNQEPNNTYYRCHPRLWVT